jgi:PKHD-type hydroxylase
MRTDLSCTLFLSDPAGYDGGELVVAGHPRPAPRIKLAAGTRCCTPAPACTGSSR